MSNGKVISVGARIHVYFEQTKCLFYVTLVDVPSEGSPYFTVKSENGDIHYVANFTRISEINPNDYRKHIAGE